MQEHHRSLTRQIGARAARAAVAAALLYLGGTGCHGASEIVIGSGVDTEFYISPLGSDQESGTRDHPWQTFAFATTRLGPGSKLILLPGIYDDATTGRLALQCGSKVANGQPHRTIEVRADKERQAFLRGNGSAPPLYMQGCSHWVIEGLHVESRDMVDAPQTPEAGSVVVLDTDNHDIVLRRLLLANPNVMLHSHVLRIGERSSDITVEESELYNFHHNGFEVTRASGVVLRRNYVNARMMADLPRGYVSPYPNTGDIGFLLEETRFAIVENNIVEGLQDGYAVVGRYRQVPTDSPTATPNPIEGNRLIGNVALGLTGTGFLLESRCLNQDPCLDRTRVVTGTELVDNVVIGGQAGVTSLGAVDTRISQLTTISTSFGVNLGRAAENAGIQCSTFTVNGLAFGFTTTGFTSMGEADWKFDHCAAFGSGGDSFLPNDMRVISPVSADPGLGACLVYLPAGSPLLRAGADARPVGAQILNRYQNGVLTTTRLWNAGSGAFTCGTVVAGLNGTEGLSCFDVHQRLHVGQATGCPLP